MNTYLIVVCRDNTQLDARRGEVVEFRIITGASAADARAECQTIADRRPLYEAYSVKLN